MLVDAAGSPVHYVERGAAAGPDASTTVLLHGFPVDHRLMLTAFEGAFAARPGQRRLYLDLPGMGASPASGVASTDDVLAVVRAAIDALVPGPYTLVGESYGGYLARGLVAADPERVRGLGLLCPMIVPEHAARDVPEHRVLVRDEGLLREVGAAALDADDVGVVQTPETWRRTEVEVAPGLAAADDAAVARIGSRYAGTFPLEPEPYDGPTLFVLGRQDSSTGYRDAWHLLEHYPRATFAVLDRAGHNLQIEQPALFEALVGEWLDRVDEAAAAG
ncbi:alpha/beta fold hydrolase [Isoptericola cucumis]|uniref:2-hydroxy-6-oxo-6-phenylhexa-2,4-dienoate hydrolase n=1 Tax=Isoptericola cucumis TaxID=1776856 RepID=A0ABQ2BAE4_9MICO|nr:alpha/beta hydrolase [Isoptericola cucumis]GGI10078.1 2-hydroxy-6-oxo-6-phenylhexa-2,4-dienoate hydrolase [Isoptericola cucumis]